jgi:hypothetical protein
MLNNISTSHLHWVNHQLNKHHQVAYTSSKLTALIEGGDRYTFTRIIQPLQCAANIFIKVYLYVYSMVSGSHA